ncbi:unnamed protein product [Phytophthora fragariaefolia]|uniref:Unnamed protein product n=1 Tax=Phytophthora fragariaefolia TaxID=1490495 RepID=A0A9W6UER7_9STRA|nr:unnamed protein product [Phytophthora fragariaefolia]
MDENVAAQVLEDVTAFLRKQLELMEKIENKPPAERRVDCIFMPHYSGLLSESWIKPGCSLRLRTLTTHVRETASVYKLSWYRT